MAMGYERVSVTYESVRTRRVRRGKCGVCGKAMSRSRTFEMTISLFNKNPDGSVRTRDEVRAAVEAKADEWEPDFTHVYCS